eukprot:g24213.t1
MTKSLIFRPIFSCWKYFTNVVNADSDARFCAHPRKVIRGSLESTLDLLAAADPSSGQEVGKEKEEERRNTRKGKKKGIRGGQAPAQVPYSAAILS